MARFEFGEIVRTAAREETANARRDVFRRRREREPTRRFRVVLERASPENDEEIPLRRGERRRQTSVASEPAARVFEPEFAARFVREEEVARLRRRNDSFVEPGQNKVRRVVERQVEPTLQLDEVGAGEGRNRRFREFLQDRSNRVGAGRVGGQLLRNRFELVEFLVERGEKRVDLRRRFGRSGARLRFRVNFAKEVRENRRPVGDRKAALIRLPTETFGEIVFRERERAGENVVRFVDVKVGGVEF